jgi:hypothetical protein
MEPKWKDLPFAFAYLRLNTDAYAEAFERVYACYKQLN